MRPCSGLGVLAARPDLRWRSQPLPELQLELLHAAAARVRPGGSVVYSVCTVNRDESEAVVDASGLDVDTSLGEAWPQFRHPRGPEFLQTLPHVHGTSGFFIARLLVRAALTRVGSCAMGWSAWIRDGSEIEPSLYAADFTRLGEQIDGLLTAGCRIFHFDVGDGHFVPPVTIGPVVLRSIAPMIHAAGGVIDCHLMVSDPARHFAEFAESGADSVTFHVEADRRPGRSGAASRVLSGSRSVSHSTPSPSRPGRPTFAAAGEAADLILCMSIEPGYSGQAFMPAAFGRIEELAALVEIPIQVDGGIGEANAEAVRDAGASPPCRRQRRLRRP